jgi:hypothetical protein
LAELVDHVADPVDREVVDLLAGVGVATGPPVGTEQRIDELG